MELGLSLGDAPKPFPDFMDKLQKMVMNKDSGLLCIGLGPVNVMNERYQRRRKAEEVEETKRKVSSDLPPVLQLDLLLSSPVQQRTHQPSNHSQLRLPWITDNLMSEPGSSDIGPVKGVHVKRLEFAAAGDDDGALQSSPNSAAPSFQMDFSTIYSGSGSGGERRNRGGDVLETNEILVVVETERGSTGSRASDDDENGLLATARKKLRLSKEQSAFLEDSFKQHHTLNPKQKLALAKQLNLRPRQVEVWFQNKRARTKLKQTEVECEYLRRCSETLREENRRLKKEVLELRALKTTACQPFFMQQQLPATTLTMCPSCARVATSTTPSAAAGDPTATPTVIASIATQPIFYSFSAASHKKTHQPTSAS